MAKIYFGRTVQYGSVTYPPNTVFEVLESEVGELSALGGWIVEEIQINEEPLHLVTIDPVLIEDPIEEEKPVTKKKPKKKAEPKK